MTWFRCIGDNGSTPPTPTGASMKVVFTSSTADSETYTITESGKYLIISAYSYSGSATITLPSGVTADIDESVISQDGRGFKAVIVELSVGDVVTMTNTTYAQWVGNTKAVIKLENISPTSVNYSNIVNDNNLQVSSLSGSGNALCIGLCAGASTNNIWDRSSHISGALVAGYFNACVYLRVLYCDISDFPTFNMYGYDGGFAGFLALQ